MTSFEDRYEVIDAQLSVDSNLSESDELTYRRLATRYVRNDIKAVYYKIDIFTRLGMNFFRRLFPVKLLDISSRGALISTDKKLKINSKIVLGLKFKTGKIFKIKASVVRKSSESKKIKIKAQTVSTLKFKLVKSYRVKILVLSKSTLSSYEYGIKFRDYNDELGSYLLETQAELKFK